MLRAFFAKFFFPFLALALSGCSMAVELSPYLSLTPEEVPTGPIQQANGKLCVDGGIVRTVLEAGGVRYYGGDFTSAGPCSSGIVRMDPDQRGDAVSLPVSPVEVHALAKDSSGRYYVAMTLGEAGEMTIKRFNADWSLDTSFNAPSFFYEATVLDRKRPFVWLHLREDSLVAVGSFMYSLPSDEDGGGQTASTAGIVAVLGLQDGSLLPQSIVGASKGLTSVDDAVFTGNRVVMSGEYGEFGFAIADVDYMNDSTFVGVTGFESPVSLLLDGNQPLAYHSDEASTNLYTIADGSLTPRAFDISACGLSGAPLVIGDGDTVYLLALADPDLMLVNLCSYSLSTNQITGVRPWDSERMPFNGRLLWGLSADRVVLSVGTRVMEFSRSDLSETYYSAGMSALSFVAAGGEFYALGEAGSSVGESSATGLYAQEIATGRTVKLPVTLELEENVEGEDNLSVRGLAVHAGKLYVGGIFTHVNGAEREGLLVLDIANGYSPVANPVPVAGLISGMSLYNNKLYMAGYSLQVGDIPEEEVGEMSTMSTNYASKLVALDLNSGLVDAGLSNQIFDGIGEDDVYTLYVNQTGIYVGGYFVFDRDDVEYWDFAILNHAGEIIGSPLPGDPGDYESVAGIVELDGKIYFSLDDYTSDKASIAELKPDMTFETKILSEAEGGRTRSLFLYDGQLQALVFSADTLVLRQVNADGSVVDSDKIFWSSSEDMSGGDGGGGS